MLCAEPAPALTAKENIVVAAIKTQAERAEAVKRYILLSSEVVKKCIFLSYEVVKRYVLLSSEVVKRYTCPLFFLSPSSPSSFLFYA